METIKEIIAKMMFFIGGFALLGFALWYHDYNFFAMWGWFWAGVATNDYFNEHDV